VGPQFANKVIGWFEIFWHKHGRYPTDSEIMAQYLWTLDQVQLLNIHPFWLNCLTNRGIALPGQPLSPIQIAMISGITNFTDKRSVRVKAAELGVNEETLNGWYANNEFKAELQLRTEQALQNSHPDVQANLFRMIENGNFNALKFYYEITGRVQTPETLNLKGAVARLVEAVQIHVKDPAVLQLIANEMKDLV
jgi:hypothetical protein